MIFFDAAVGKTAALLGQSKSPPVLPTAVGCVSEVWGTQPSGTMPQATMSDLINARLYRADSRSCTVRIASFTRTLAIYRHWMKLRVCVVETEFQVVWFFGKFSV